MSRGGVMRQSRDANDLSRLDRHLLDAMESGRDPGTLVAAVLTTETAPSTSIIVETVIVAGDADPLDVYSARHMPLARRGRAGDVSILRAEDRRGLLVLSAWPAGMPGVFHLVGTVPTTDPRWKKVERRIASSAPGLLPCFLNHDDFVDLGEALSTFGDVEVVRSTARRFADTSSVVRAWPARSGEPRLSTAEVIREAEAEGESVRNLTLQVAKVMSVQVRRTAGATFYSGDFAAFADVVLTRLAAAAAARRRLLSGRQRELNQPAPPAISVRLADRRLADAASTGRVLSAVAAQPQTGVAVLHRNPYLHLIVTDDLDGSNFDVFVTSADAIDVLPGYRASLGALTRLTQTLSDVLGADEIIERPVQPPVMMADLLAHG
jgi:hypothetical protein